MKADERSDIAFDKYYFAYAVGRSNTQLSCM